MSFKGSSFCCSALLGVWTNQGQNQRPDLVRALGPRVTGSREDRCGPHSPSLAGLCLPRGDSPRAASPPPPTPPAPANRRQLVTGWPSQQPPPLSPPLASPRPESLGLAPSLAVSTQSRGPPLSPSASLSRAPARPPASRGGDLKRRPRGCPSAPPPQACGERPALRSSSLSRSIELGPSSSPNA